MILIQKTSIGVDLGSSAVKAVRVNGKTITLAAFKNLTKEDRQDTGALIKSLKDFFMKIKIYGADIKTGLPGDKAYIKTITLPVMPMNELKEAVRWESKKYLPSPAEAQGRGPSEDIIFDFIAKKTTEGITVTFASTEKTTVMNWIRPLQEAGVKITTVDVTPLALGRALIKDAQEGNVVIADIGALKTEIDILKDGILRMTRTIELGGNFLISSMEKAGVTNAEERLLQGMEKELKGPVDRLATEIYRSMDYYKANFKESTFTTLILSGGIALVPGLKDYLAGLFDFPVLVRNPFNGIKLKNEEIRALGPRFSVALGLAMRKR